MFVNTPSSDENRNDDPLSRSERFDLLSHPQRRTILRYLRSHRDITVRVEDLADHLVAETDVDAPEEVRIVLHHTHLPKLADVGVIDYDTRSKTVRYRGDMELERVLEVVRDLG